MTTATLSHSDTHNRPTMYEIAWRLPSGEIKAFGYSARKTKGTLLGWAQSIGGFIISNSPNPDADATYNRRNGWDFGGVQVFYSGGTEAHPLYS